MLPRDHDAAARLARDHDHRAKDPATDARAEGPIRHAIEIRHDSFLTPEFVDLLRGHDIALVVSDNPGLYPVAEEPTTDFMYLRLHGAERMYYGSYSDPALDDWADRVRAWARGREPADPARITDRDPPPARSRNVYLYFDNDEKTRAPFDARRLMERLHLADDFPTPGSRDAMPE
jgi:uncharacterized protein YecE (DUF72 family)